MSIDGAGSWQKVDVVLNGLGRAQCSSLHGFDLGEPVGSFLGEVSVFVRYANDLAPVVCQLGFLPIGDHFRHFACGLSLIIVVDRC